MAEPAGPAPTTRTSASTDIESLLGVSDERGGGGARENLHELCEPTLRLGGRPAHAGAGPRRGGFPLPGKKSASNYARWGCENASAGRRCRCRRQVGGQGEPWPRRERVTSRRTDWSWPRSGPASSISSRAAAGRRASCSTCSRPDPSTPTTACSLLPRELRQQQRGSPTAAGRVTGQRDDRLGARAQRPDQTGDQSAAGPPPGGSSRRKVTVAGERSLGPDDRDSASSAARPGRPPAATDRPGRRPACRCRTAGPARPAERSTELAGHRRPVGAFRIDGRSSPPTFSRGRRASAPAWRWTRSARPPGRSRRRSPQPAYRRICRGSVSSTMPQRSAIPHSPSPWASIQPTGPAYRSRSRCSSSAIVARAFSVGVPQTAALGCRAAARPSDVAVRAGDGGDVGGQVQHVGQLQHVRRVGHVHPGAVRRQRIRHRGCTAYSCSSRSLLDRASAAAERQITVVVPAALDGAGQHPGGDQAVLPAQQHLRGGADQPVDQVAPAPLVPLGQPRQDPARIDRLARPGPADRGPAPPSPARRRRSGGPPRRPPPPTAARSDRRRRTRSPRGGTGGGRGRQRVVVHERGADLRHPGRDRAAAEHGPRHHQVERAAVVAGSNTKLPKAMKPAPEVCVEVADRRPPGRRDRSTSPPPRPGWPACCAPPRPSRPCPHRAAPRRTRPARAAGRSGGRGRRSRPSGRTAGAGRIGAGHRASQSIPDLSAPVVAERPQNLTAGHRRRFRSVRAHPLPERLRTCAMGTPRRPTQALAGVLAALAALGVGHSWLRSSSRPAASPLVAVGSVAVDAAPTPVKESRSGLLGNVGQAGARSAASRSCCWSRPLAIGLLAWRRPRTALVAIGALGLVGCGGGAGSAAGSPPAGSGALCRRSSPRAVGVRRAGPDQTGPTAQPADDRSGDSHLDGGSRRRLLATLAGVGVLAAVGAGVGEAVNRTRQAARELIRLPRRGRRRRPIPDGVQVAGVQTFTTPDDAFYRVDISLVTPRVDVARGSCASTAASTARWT